MKKLRIVLNIILLICSVLSVISAYAWEEDSALFWPPPPEQMRISFVKSVYNPSDFGIKAGFLRKLKG